MSNQISVLILPWFSLLLQNVLSITPTHQLFMCKLAMLIQPTLVGNMKILSKNCKQISFVVCSHVNTNQITNNPHACKKAFIFQV